MSQDDNIRRHDAGVPDRASHSLDTTAAVLPSKKLSCDSFLTAVETRFRHNHHSPTLTASTIIRATVTTMQAASTNSAPYAVQMMTTLRKLVCIEFSNSACSVRDVIPCVSDRGTRSLGTRGKKDRASIQPAVPNSSRARQDYGAQMRRILFTATEH